ncbi:lateral signaling target protein 2 homolog isoform X3 [Polypterus senegalus]|uniref:lateral signaling target protein 2 homolog isoform X3 n=1 Tax=Polypterus senegalus TaxID=55291 RepID=UPI001966932E|nr:lateral signaling target protein 2 homolog isoform X3 [Polypterus senegalus]
MLPALMKRWLWKPKRSDMRPLAQFYYADEDVTRVTAELNGLDLRKDLQKYLLLLHQLRTLQDRMLQTIEAVMEECIPNQRQSRQYQIKFPDEILHENLGVQLWFAAECLSAGSFLEVREAEGLLLRPLAEDLLRSLEVVRLLLREQSLGDFRSYSAHVQEALLQYDHSYCQFELRYISTVIPVKSAEELQQQQEIVVLFCETVSRALTLGYLSQDLIDGYEPLLMFTIPRLAIICGLLIYPEGPLDLGKGADELSPLFRPFYSLLEKIRDLLLVLTPQELHILEKSLCAAESNGLLCSVPSAGSDQNTIAPNTCEAAECMPSLETTQQDFVMDSQASITAQPGSQFLPYTHNDRVPSSLFPHCPFNQNSSQDLPGLECRTLTPVSQGGWDRRTPRMAVSNQTLIFHGHGHQPIFHGHGHQPGVNIQEYGTDAQYPLAESSQERLASGNGLSVLNQGRPQRSGSWSIAPKIHEVESMDTTKVPYRWESPVAGLPPQVNGRTSSMPRGQQHYTMEDTRRKELRARYRSSSDMIHRLFVCISGVADQLQTNFASDMRLILKSVFEVTASKVEIDDQDYLHNPEEEVLCPRMEVCILCEELSSGHLETNNPAAPPTWVPDSACDCCSACRVVFTFLRRRHHCRSCGKIFCSSCSSNMAPIPRFGLMKPVRVCIHCFNFHTGGDPAQC